MRKARLFLWFAAATAIAVYGALNIYQRGTVPRTGDDERQKTAEQVAREIVTGEFDLVGSDLEAVSDTDFRGNWLLVFFGFTHCPDVCPTTLGTIALIMDELGPEAERMQPVFITVDPERDTPEVIGSYVAAFHPKIVGLTGTEQQIAAAAKSYRAYYARIPLRDGDGSADDYTMDHSAHIYLIDPDGIYATVFSPADPIGTILKTLRARMAAQAEN
ncbi:MAG: SCO family protein [Rhodospirillales bacterium]|nr:MAG: SCO family protein [Rhodospirillales bacterium]